MRLCRWHGLPLVLLLAWTGGCPRGESPSDQPVAASRARLEAEPAVDKIVEVVAGPESTCARSSRGRVACIGAGMAFTDDLPAIDTHVPQVVPVPPSKAISAGAGFACSIDREGGAVRCWGSNASKQLGRATPGSVDHQPQPVPGLEGMQQLVTHGTRTCALKDASVSCWPESPLDDEAQESVVRVYPVGTRTTARALLEHTKGWRNLPLHDYGSSDAVDVQRPWDEGARNPCPFVDPQGHDEDEDDEEMMYRSRYDCSDGIEIEPGMEVGLRHACVVRDGHLRCQGKSSLGQLPPEEVARSGATVDFAVGSEHTCAVSEEGELVCWGASMRGQVGLQPSHSRAPVVVASEVERVWVADGATCMKTRAGLYACATASRSVCAEPEFAELRGPSGIREMVQGSGMRACLVDSLGSVWCGGGGWSEVLPSALFSGTAESRTQFTAYEQQLCWLEKGRPSCVGRLLPHDGYAGESPSVPLGDTSTPFGSMDDAVQLRWVDDMLCARSASNELRCLAPTQGYVDDASVWTWDAVALPTGPVTDLSGDGWALVDGSGQRVWGLSNVMGRRARPARIRSNGIRLPKGASAVQVAGDCARLVSGQVHCDPGPQLPSDLRFEELVGTDDHSCALDSQADLWCWGDATGGRLGHGDPICTDAPVVLTTAFHDAWEAAGS